MHLLIVESPSKAKTLKKYLGPEFEVLASYGHVRGLVRKDGSVDVEHEFAMKYEVLSKSSKHVDNIVAALKNADTLLLATDPDREGEAISWHLLEILKTKHALENKTVQRVVFHEITKTAVLHAVAHPRDIDLNLVNAQQARSALDYLVGFNLSPLLWKKIRRGLSAGRVQSPALRLIVEREAEIRAFQSQEYWSIHLGCDKNGQPIQAKLHQWQGEKLDTLSIANAAQKDDILQRLEQQAQALRVARVEKRQKQRHAAAPFTTSTLLQESVRKLGLATDRTMRIAQQLYEGVSLGSETVGLISYMRTDSVALAQEAIDDIRGYIGEHFSPDYLPKAPNTYKNKSKNAQEAHEAIRPTAISRTPDSVRAYLTPEQAKLYEMIWKRTLASQMNAAIYDTVSADIATAENEAVFRASGQVLVFPGFVSVYLEGQDDTLEDDESRLPALNEGDLLQNPVLSADQHFTQPPPRYSEASLVKALEEFGIGRPSTYPSIISTLKDREYVVADKKRLLPTDVGEVVNRFLTEHFSTYVDYHFTAHLEDQLDHIAHGDCAWVPVLEAFWHPFHQQIEEKSALRRKDVTQETLDEACPKCGNTLTIRLGKRGRFVGCSTYPECDYTRNLNESAEEAAEEAAAVVIEGRTCPDCNSPLHIKQGRYGKFIGCSGYPKCKHIEPLEKPKDSGITCPTCHQGTLIERKSRYGKLFYSCSTYPKCTYATWNPPINEPCPQCQWPIMTIKTTKRRGTEKVCPQKECGYAEAMPSPENSETAGS